MKSKILLITSSFEEASLISKKNPNESIQYLGPEVAEKEHYALGLAYLHSYLESKENKVEGLYLNNYPPHLCFKKIKDKLKRFSPRCCGIQIMTPNRVSSYKTIEYIHKEYPNIKIVVGGIHATLMYEQLLEKFPYILVVLGEGEITFEELIKKFEKNSKNLKSIEGIAYNQNGKIVRTKLRPMVENLDIFPFPKHDIFFEENRDFGCLLTSRGCPFKCSFCSINPLTKRRVRFRSIKNVVDEIEYMVNSFPQLKRIWVHDDTFFLDNERVIKICDEIIKRGIKTEFICSGRMKPITEKMIKKLEQANFKTVLLGLESGCDEILKRSKKMITKQDALSAFKLFKNSSINLKVFLITGLPGETKETSLETAQFIKELQKIKYVSVPNSVNYLRIYPGTEIYEIAKKNGVISDEYWLTEQPTPFYTLENSSEDLWDYGEILLNHIAWRRTHRLKAFKKQWDTIPYLLRYLLFYKKELIVETFFKKITFWKK